MVPVPALLRALVTLCVIAAAVAGVRAWSARAAASSRLAGDWSGAEEVPLRAGNYEGPSLWRFAQQGFPWSSRAADIREMHDTLPPDSGRPLAETEGAIDVALGSRRFRYTTDAATVAELIAVLNREVAGTGVSAYTREPLLPDAYTVAIPDMEWTGTRFLNAIRAAGEGRIHMVATSRGVCIGTDEACRAARAEEELAIARRRVVAEHADGAVSVRYRPDVVDANIVAWAREVESQTGVPIVVDARIWEKGPVFTWRRPPLPLRDALDRIAAKLGAIWRVRDGEVFLLLP